MRIVDIIARLEAIREEYGNLPVFFKDYYGTDNYLPGKLEVNELEVIFESDGRIILIH